VNNKSFEHGEEPLPEQSPPMPEEAQQLPQESTNEWMIYTSDQKLIDFLSLHCTV